MTTPVSILPKGTKFARMAMCLAKARGDIVQAHQIAASLYSPLSDVAVVLKSSVSPGAMSNPNWSAVADYRFIASEFVQALRPLTVLGRMNGYRRVPLKIKVPRATASTTIGWVGEGSPAPLTGLQLDTVTMDNFKVAGIVVVTSELAKLSSPSAEGVVRDDLIAGTAQMIDQSFLDPNFAGEAGVSPASITYGAPNIAASGTTMAALRSDLKTLFASLTDNGINLVAPYLITSRRQALALALSGDRMTEGVTVNGGMLAGVPLLTSSSAPASAPDSPAGAQTATITLVDAAELLVADNDEATIDYSEEAALQMDSMPDSPPTGSTVMVSLYQNGLAAWRVSRAINYKPRRPNAVAYITGANYAG